MNRREDDCPNYGIERNPMSHERFEAFCGNSTNESMSKLPTRIPTVWHGASLWYPIMLAQEFGEISESKGSELLGMDIITYREHKQKAIQAVKQLVESLPSPMDSLLHVIEQHEARNV